MRTGGSCIPRLNSLQQPHLLRSLPLPRTYHRSLLHPHPARLLRLLLLGAACAGRGIGVGPLPATRAEPAGPVRRLAVPGRVRPAAAAAAATARASAQPAAPRRPAPSLLQSICSACASHAAACRP